MKYAIQYSYLLPNTELQFCPVIAYIKVIRLYKINVLKVYQSNEGTFKNFPVGHEAWKELHGSWCDSCNCNHVHPFAG